MSVDFRRVLFPVTDNRAGKKKKKKTKKPGLILIHSAIELGDYRSREIILLGKTQKSAGDDFADRWQMYPAG